ncbi:MAG: ribosome biogenesis GTPase Der [Candidatus Komeilibacteria bacterium CG10_big_fil_rev_8_21_14_0_10_41_13]|uniref:GTPase Der n=1 Tax=Candidatus Komeilibacteria bacterium CG10_big_fil_rev_8_21_14_0_10_41_13 TaxID=1974476 RepID=A0A2M6WBW8_9BACT|nr:MAG: ribosome biogenesis GTPase Der [Candidatus Komeilibacteria bacterium CG10_big_fil_rev_8_21_14_0_10_41_13]
MNNLPKVALIGRANVGKSTLFNRLGEDRKAIVSSIPGTTRDRKYTQVEWQGLSFVLIDTGGVDLVHDQEFEDDIIKQAGYALEEADLILFVVDIKNGLMPQDKEIGKILKKQAAPVLLVANKGDTQGLKKQIDEFYKLSFGQPIPVSAINGTGSGDLLDLVVKQLKTLKQKKVKTKTIKDNLKIAIIGKPNVGKSSLVNAILGEERVIVSPMPYTTRDSQDISLNYKGQHYTLIDTAGIRKQHKIRDRLERYSVKQSLKSIERADVTLLVTDASLSLSKQDKTLSDAIQKTASSLIIIANKWDLIEEKNQSTINKFTKYYRQLFPYLAYAPIIFTSATEKQRVKNILDLSREVYNERFREITDNALNKFIKKLIDVHPPARGKGTKQPKIYDLKQLSQDPPTFELIKDPQSDLHHSYVRFVENRLREKFGFLGTPIIIRLRKLNV